MVRALTGLAPELSEFSVRPNETNETSHRQERDLRHGFRNGRDGCLQFGGCGWQSANDVSSNLALGLRSGCRSSLCNVARDRSRIGHHVARCSFYRSINWSGDMLAYHHIRMVGIQAVGLRWGVSVVRFPETLFGNASGVDIVWVRLWSLRADIDIPKKQFE